MSLSYCVSQCVLCDGGSMGERECPSCIRKEDQSNFPLGAPKLVGKTVFPVLSAKIILSGKNPTLLWSKQYALEMVPVLTIAR